MVLRISLVIAVCLLGLTGSYALYQKTLPAAGVGLQQSDGILEISDKMFLTQINDIYVNFPYYEGSTICVEGMFGILQSLDTSFSVPAVFRFGPGCCGNDGWGGFLLKNLFVAPQQNDWIRVTGRPLLVASASGGKDLYLDVQSLEIKQERGKEFVVQ